MPPPTVRVNTFIKEKKDIHLDRTSKIFIFSELICGINRLPVLGNTKPIYLILSFVLSLSININIINLTYYKFSYTSEKYLDVLKLMQYCICAVLGFVLRKRLRAFYAELSTFDNDTNFVEDKKDIMKNVVQTCLTVGFTIILYIILAVSDIFKQYTLDVITILLVHVGELHFFGHLISLLIPRVRFIRHLMKSSFDVTRVSTIENEMLNAKNEKYSPDIRKLMDFYYRIIVAFDTLNDAIKWQMLIILVTTFISTLSLSYHITLQLIRNQYVMTNVLVNLMLTVVEMAPMFAPCRVVDVVNGEVHCLIELLSTKLYENKIEKSNRTVAQALLSLMEARDLSLSLLRIFDIDISFPFKFLGLLITYLIILLQFEKVINLDRVAESFIYEWVQDGVLCAQCKTFPEFSDSDFSSLSTLNEQRFKIKFRASI